MAATLRNLMNDTDSRAIRPVPGFDVPPDDRCAPIHEGPIPVAGRPALIWLLAAHGGAGVTTLERQLGLARDSRRYWPQPAEGESPFVVVVAVESERGLSAAHDMLVQHKAGGAGGGRCLGLVTRPATPSFRGRRMPADLRRKLELVSAAADRHWQLKWHDECASIPSSELASVTPSRLSDWRDMDARTRKKLRRSDDLRTEVPHDVLDLAVDLIDAVARNSRKEAR